MRKITALVLSSFFFVSLASAEIGVNVGVSLSAGAFQATGTETEKDEKNKEDAVGAAGWGSIFVEKALGERFAIGIDYVPSALESETSTLTQKDIKGVGTSSADAANKVQVDFNDLTTLYVSVNLTDNLYAKVGHMSVDVDTNETLGTGSKYGNTSLDGTLVALGWNTGFGNNMFVRVEGNYMQFDGASLTSSTNSDNKIELTDLNGASAKLSVGKSF
tara:strand:+ start:63 stop:716 length:654 start_codon:yes stop_codon:yes gene_type:complete